MENENEDVEEEERLGVGVVRVADALQLTSI
jgi:hypothetical protein